METIDPATARRIAVAASGLATKRPEQVGDRQLRGVVGRLGLLQIDSVSVLARAHYMPAFSRLGAYDKALLDAAAWSKTRWMFEYWAHEASLVPFKLQPLFRWRMERAASGHGIYGELGKFAAENRAYLREVEGEVRRRGPTRAGELPGEGGGGGWWGWSHKKRALEFLFWAGVVSVAGRRGFERLYDVTERAIPRRVLALPTPNAADAQRELLRLAARALGIATAADLRDYYRLPAKETPARIAELVEAGELLPIQVPGWAQTAYVHRDARRPRRVAAQALLSPFDPLIWHRPRIERLFGFRYRIEIYTPAARREHGYYVLPFLLGDQLVARVDLKADRKAQALLVLSCHFEPGAPARTADALSEELRTMALWLGLEQVRAKAAGDGALLTA